MPIKSIGIRLPLLLILLPACVQAAENLVEVRDAVVAVVDKDVITRSQVMEQATDELKAIPTNLSPDDHDLKVAEALAVALRRIVDDKLIAAEGKRLVDANATFKQRVEDQVAEKMEDERRKAGGETQFRDQITASGLTYDEYIDRLRQEIIRQVVVYQFVLKDLSISPQALRLYYEEHLDQFRENEQVRYRQIFIRAASYESREKAKEMAAYVMELLSKQHDFAELAKKYSNGPRAQEGGLYDFQNRGARPAPIDSLLFSLKPGEVGGPIESEQGFTILRVEDRREGRVKPFEEVQGYIESEMLITLRTRRYAELIERLQKEHHVEMLL